MNRDDLVAAIRQKGTFLCVGIDPDPKRIPAHLGNGPQAVLAFNKAIIDATRSHCVAYKPNLAFYESMGPEGWQVLRDTIAHIGHSHFLIADAKRGDIGNTAQMYARTFFETYPFHAVTVAPYMGSDSITPFLGWENKWAIVLALTSNAGAADFQLKPTQQGKPLYQEVIEACRQWGTPRNLMYVVGATRPEYLSTIRNLVPEHFLVVPGVGAQGGSLEEVCAHGLNSHVGLLINASRSILYASANEDFAEAAAAEAAKMAAEMKHILREKALL
jgi:orotidine-5'-phosphate decarboxylase